MSSWTAVAGSWALVTITIILGWYYYTRDGGQLKRVGKQRANGSIVEIANDTILQEPQKKQKKKSQKGITTPATVRDEQPAKESTASVKTLDSGLQKRKDVKVNKPAQSSSVDPSPANHTIQKETDIDVKEFARQMTKAKAGTSFSNAGKDTQRVRTQKQSKMNGSFGPGHINGEAAHSGTSSNTGGDADDDLSSVNSPGLSAITSPADTTGVSDMLESTGPGPASLRITEPLVPVKPKTIHVKKQEVVETKKQRQNRLKREREKEANREAEAQRKVLEEKQRRTAREAEGRPAKNGNGWTYDSGLPANAWSTGQTKAQPVNGFRGGLLDTTEEATRPPTIIDNVSSLSSSNGKVNGTNGSTTPWNDNLPSEEEQLRIIQEQSEESEWTTVSQPKRNKRKEQAGL